VNIGKLAVLEWQRSSLPVAWVPQFKGKIMHDCGVVVEIFHFAKLGFLAGVFTRRLQHGLNDG